MRRRELIVAGLGLSSLAGCLGYTIEEADHVRELEASLEDKRTTIDDLETQVDARSAEINELENQLETKRSTIETIETERDELTLEVATKQEDITTLEAEVSDYRTEVEQLQAELAHKRGEISELERTSEQQQTELVDLQNRIDSLEDAHDFSDDELTRGAEIANAIRDAVTFIWHDWGSGTAFHIGNGTYLTAYHVVRSREDEGPFGLDIESVQWTFDLGDADDRLDTQVLLQDYQPPGAIEVSPAGEPAEDDALVMVGHPHNVGSWVASIGRYMHTDSSPGIVDEAYIANIPIRGRNSGSPVVNLDGEFVGIAIASQQNREQYFAPETPITSFAGYEPDGMIVPATAILDRFDLA